MNRGWRVQQNEKTRPAQGTGGAASKHAAWSELQLLSSSAPGENGARQAGVMDALAGGQVDVERGRWFDTFHSARALDRAVQFFRGLQN